MVQYLYDAFDGAADTALTAHNPDVGDASSWSIGGGGFELDGVGNARVIATGGFAYGYNTTSTRVSDDYEVSAKVVLSALGGLNILGVCARATAPNTMYIAWIKGNGGASVKT